MRYRERLMQLKRGRLFLTDEGDPAELAAGYRGLRPRLRQANVLGGCCGTDHRHVAEVCTAWLG
jgi:methionine synthase I (cobalamin-dependent)